MKTQMAFAALCGALVSAAPIVERAGVSDTAKDMDAIVSKKGTCAPVAVLFARGTFDSGNIGVWVGPQFEAALKSSIPNVAFQGVDPTAYKADLSGYLSQGGGSNDGAASMAKAVIDYASACPDSAIILSGWSQGAVVAHKALQGLDKTNAPDLEKVVGLITFGDPNHVWNNLPLPKSIPSSSFSSYCVTGSVPDPLCAHLPQDFKFPTSVDDIIGPFKKLPTFAVGEQQAAAAGSLVVNFPRQLLKSFSSFVKALQPSQFVRLLLTPEHFTYGNNGMAKTAALFVANIPAVKTAIANGGK